MKEGERGRVCLWKGAPLTISKDKNQITGNVPHT